MKQQQSEKAFYLKKKTRNCYLAISIISGMTAILNIITLLSFRSGGVSSIFFLSSFNSTMWGLFYLLSKKRALIVLRPDYFVLRRGILKDFRSYHYSNLQKVYKQKQTICLSISGEVEEVKIPLNSFKLKEGEMIFQFLKRRHVRLGTDLI